MPVRGMLDHVTVVASDFAASATFYDAALAPLGFSRVMDFPEAVGYGGVDGKPDFWIVAGDPVTTGVHVAFAATSRDAVSAFFDLAIASGGTTRHEPKEWPIYHEGYFGAFVNDPDGNNIEAVHHG